MSYLLVFHPSSSSACATVSQAANKVQGFLGATSTRARATAMFSQPTRSFSSTVWRRSSCATAGVVTSSIPSALVPTASAARGAPSSYDATVGQTQLRGYKSFKQSVKGTSPTPRWVKRLLLLSERHRMPTKTRVHPFSDDVRDSATVQNRLNRMRTRFDACKVADRDVRDGSGSLTSLSATLQATASNSAEVGPRERDEEDAVPRLTAGGDNATSATSTSTREPLRGTIGRAKRSPANRDGDGGSRHHGSSTPSKTSASSSNSTTTNNSDSLPAPPDVQFDVWSAEECERHPVRPVHPLLQSVRTGLLAYKMGMICLYDDWGQRHTITVAKVDRLRVCASKTIQSHGYSAVQLGIGYKPVEQQRKTELGGFLKAGVGPKDELHEFRVSPDCVLPVGHRLSVRHFVAGQWCFVSGHSQARGWLGVMQRHNFSGQMRANHEKQHRAPGSIGCKGDGKVWAGKKMAGHQGPDPRAMNVKIFRIDARRELLYLKGTVPGRKGAVIKISDARGKTQCKNAHIRMPYPTFCPQPGVKYPVTIDQPVKQYDPFLYPDQPLYQPDDDRF